MKDSTRERLRLLDRALRPGAAARRAQAQVAAEGNDRLAELRDELARTQAAAEGARAEAATARELASGLHARLDAVDGLLIDLAAAAGVIDRRNVDYDRWTAQIVLRTLGPTDSAVDVGAHSGAILRAILAAAPEGRHLAFEPIPELAAGLRRDFPGVEVHEVALSDREGEAEFHHVVGNPSFSGLQRRSDVAAGDVAPLRVRTARLDDLVDPDLPVRLLKIDVEGGEVGVLRGAPELLARCRPVVVFELGQQASGSYGVGPVEVHELFSGLGMAVSLLDAYLEGRPPLSRAELEQQYETGENYYFVAHPAPASP